MHLLRVAVAVEQEEDELVDAGREVGGAHHMVVVRVVDGHHLDEVAARAIDAYHRQVSLPVGVEIEALVVRQCEQADGVLLLVAVVRPLIGEGRAQEAEEQVGHLHEVGRGLEADHQVEFALVVRAAHDGAAVVLHHVLVAGRAHLQAVQHLQVGAVLAESPLVEVALHLIEEQVGRDFEQAAALDADAAAFGRLFGQVVNRGVERDLIDGVGLQARDLTERIDEQVAVQVLALEQQAGAFALRDGVAEQVPIDGDAVVLAQVGLVAHGRPHPAVVAVGEGRVVALGVGAGRAEAAQEQKDAQQAGGPFDRQARTNGHTSAFVVAYAPLPRARPRRNPCLCPRRGCCGKH